MDRNRKSFQDRFHDFGNSVPRASEEITGSFRSAASHQRNSVPATRADAWEDSNLNGGLQFGTALLEHIHIFNCNILDNGKLAREKKKRKEAVAPEREQRRYREVLTTLQSQVILS